MHFNGIDWNCADISESRLEIAKKMGATFTVLVDSKDPRAIAKKITETFGQAPDITIECSGAESSIQTAIYVRHISFA